LPEAYHGLVSELDGAVPDPSRTWAPTLRRLLPQAALRHFIPFVRRFVRNRALPHYDRANTAEWQLLRHILKAWIAESRSPVLVVPIPLAQFILRSGDDGPCRARYNELAAETGCDFYDPLPDFWRLDENVRQALWNHKNGHFTDKGHEVLADLLQPHIAAALERKAVA
jgi:hypothetical protein